MILSTNSLSLASRSIVGAMGLFKTQDGTSDPIITRMVAEDKVPWYKKPNLRIMYLYLFTCCMGVEITSGFDSQLINTLQFSAPFNKCMNSEHDRYQAKADVTRLWKRLC